MKTLTTIASLIPWHGCTFVPTMGALHEGHLALIRQGARLGKPVVVSIYVNPTQFAPHEDFAAYPRQLEQDLDAAAAAGASAAFVPASDLIYPPDTASTVPDLPAVATEPKLEDADRPHFFSGVCTVVSRLFDLVQPAHAIFGEKDWQQLQVIRAMVAAEPARFPLQVHAGRTIREPDGLALSSRNAYLSPTDRQRATALSRALADARAADGLEAAEAAMLDRLQQASMLVDYAVVRDAATLLPPADGYASPLRALIAARLDSVRLIDNGPV